MIPSTIRSIRPCPRADPVVKSVSEPEAGGSTFADAPSAGTSAAVTTRRRSTHPITPGTRAIPSSRAMSREKSGSTTTRAATTSTDLGWRRHDTTRSINRSRDHEDEYLRIGRLTSIECEVRAVFAASDPPPVTTRRVSAKGTISFAVVCEDGLVQLHHRGVLTATDARRHALDKQTAAVERGRKPRPISRVPHGPRWRDVAGRNHLETSGLAPGDAVRPTPGASYQEESRSSALRMSLRFVSG